jgi:Protein of unknown function (DUF3617)
MMQFRAGPLALAVAAALCTGGCGEQKAADAKLDVKGESMASVADKVAASSLNPRPGRWEAAMRLEKMEIGNMPPEVKAAMAQQQGMTQTYATCLTPQQAARPNADFFKNDAKDCTYDHFTMAGGRIDAALTCKPGAGPTKMNMTGTYGADLYDIRITGEGEMQPGMEMSMAMTVTSRRTGECTGKEIG